MIAITNEQIERVSLILGSVPNGAEKALSSVVRRANTTVRTEAVKGITNTYAISAQNVRAETTINMRTRKVDGGIVGTVSFAGYKLPLYRFNVTPTVPVQRATVKAAVLKENTRTPFEHAFIAKMKSGHTGMFERDTTARTPITEFMGPSTAQMAGNSVVLEQVEQAAQETVSKRIEQEINRILNGYGVKK
ncbi:MAG: phage tail protein [Oscillibacter ruminantium]|uniref:phage tail protein n=1 Tax=Oscillibacter ruminantium TaxID=1263547 RepID=UPI002B1FD808|nr:phage tail protein [Oscillibacter ruminantium]MEA5041373.1 phage tail protein [Oscillibacter ruminantium]